MTSRPQHIPTPQGALEYLDAGAGAPVIALHGAMGGYDQGAILAKTVLKDTCRVLALSRPGYLGTPLSSGPTPEEQADLLALLLDALQIEKAPVMAISGGGPCAIHFALRHSDRCAALVLISTVSQKNEIKIPASFYLLKWLCKIDFLRTRMQQKALRDIAQTARRSITHADLRERMLADQDAQALFFALTASTFDRMPERLPGSENDFKITQTHEYPLEDLRVPTLIVHGTHDPHVNFARHAQSAAARIPHAELLTLENGEHAAIFTHRKTVQEKVAAFLRQQTQ